MKHQNQSKVTTILTILMGFFILAGILLLLSQTAVVHAGQLVLIGTPVPDNEYFTTITKTLGNGVSLEGYIIHGPPNPPPGYELERTAVELPKPNPAMAINSLTVPAFDWVFGCSSVSGAMIAGYYDRNGFANMYTGPTDGGVMPLDNSSWGTWSDGVDTYPNLPLAASHNGVDGRVTRGSIDDYWVEYGSSASDPYITGSWTQHTWSDAIGDYMKTSQSAYGNVDSSTTFWGYTTSASPLTCADMLSGGISTTDGTYGRKLFYEARGYTVTDCYSQKTDNTVAGGFSFAQFKAEIDAGQPVMLNLAGHTIVGVGYNDTGNTVYVHDTWDYLTHSMTWGTSYGGMQLLSVSIVNLQSTAPTGILSGTVIDSRSDPIAGATVDVSGGHTTTADATGHYAFTLEAGTYSVTASKYGYVSNTLDGIVVTPPGTTTQNITLATAAPATVSGLVTDADTSWPLYASIDISGYPDGPVWTDPVTGAYSVVLPEGGPYTFSVNAWVPGYNSASQSVGPLAGDQTENFALSADAATCNAPGYEKVTGLFTENFDAAIPPALPANWAQADVSGTAGNWAINAGSVHPSGVAAHSGSNLAYFNSWTASSGNQTLLYQTTGINMTTLSNPALSFWMYHDTVYSSSDDRLQVVESANGTTFYTVGSAISRYDGSTGWKQHSVDLSAYGSQPDLYLGFLGISEYGNDIHIDDISVDSCGAQAGGLVVGNVYDANTNASLADATVSNDSTHTTFTAATTDPAVDDGFYTLFSPAGSHSFTASLGSSYSPDTDNVGVILNSTVQHDFYLDAPSLTYSPLTLEATLLLGDSMTIPFTLTNVGGVLATFELQENDGSFTPASVITGQRTITQVAGPHLPDARHAPDRVGSSAPIHSVPNATLLTNEGFELGAVPPTGWSEVVNNPSYNWKIMTVGTPYSGTYSADVEYDPTVVQQNEWLLSPEMSLSEGTLSFWSLGSIYWCRDDYDNCDLNVWIVVDAVGGGDDILVGKGDDAWPSSWTWAQSSFDLTSLLPGDPVRIGFEYAGLDGAQVALDEIMLDDNAGYTDIPWLSESPVSGTIPAGNDLVIDITFDASVVTLAGEYDGTLYVLSDDPVNPEITVPVTMTVTNDNPVPTTTGLSPSSTNAGGAAFTLTVNGTNFIDGSIVRWKGSDRTTTYVSSTQLTASIPATDIAAAGTASVTVFNPAPGGGTSNTQTFTINNRVPTTTGLSPSSKTAGGAAFTLTVNGTNFIDGSTVRWNGSNRTTTYVSSTQLTASIPATDIAAAGTASVTVFNPTPGGGTSNAQTFTINNRVPTTTGLSPSSKMAGGAAFTLTVNGTNFIDGSTVRWNGSNRTTTYVSSTQLTASIPATDIAAAGTGSVTVFNPTPGGGTSNAQTFTINNRVPTTTGLSPSSKMAGEAAFTLTVNGTNFIDGSIVRWKGSDRTTTYVSSTQLTASIPASDIAAAGTASVTVFNPTPGGGTSNAQTFTINNRVPTTTGLSPTSTNAGGAAFTLTVNGTNFIDGSTVRWNGSNRTTTYVSSTQLTASIPATDIAAAGTASVTVFNATPGGGTSNAQTFTINNRVPTTTGLSPSSTTAGGAAFTLTVNGTNFVNGSTVRWNGSNRTTTYISSTQLTASIPATDIAAAGTASVTVFNATPGGGTSNAQTFTINTVYKTFLPLVIR